ncbi:sortase family protein [Ilumatobacter fluminis]|uniref:Sortase family protein n=1 Tax=Ilumatobacter fluminis TaxID=467091 RepID=A0A4R7HY42_9ACTN|nr:class F sortase [Ilumatobacter fluminis]TDT16005.1 sortase family protein [Ilumatobacter fluminis]
MSTDTPDLVAVERRRTWVRRGSTAAIVAFGTLAVVFGVLAVDASQSEQPATFAATARLDEPFSIDEIDDRTVADVLGTTPQRATPPSTSQATETADPSLAMPQAPSPRPTVPALSDRSTTPASQPAPKPSGSTPAATLDSTTTPVTATTPDATTTVPTIVAAPRPDPAPPILIRSSGVSFGDLPVVPVGTEPNGELTVPGAFEIGWYERGGMPFGPGATVLAAHVTWNGDLGAFYHLGRSEPGDLIGVTTTTGDVRAYVVTEVTMYGKYDLPGDRIWRDDGPEELVLITCGGSFDESINRYRDNIVVFAEPVDLDR